MLALVTQSLARGPRNDAYSPGDRVTRPARNQASLVVSILPLFLHLEMRQARQALLSPLTLLSRQVCLPLNLALLKVL